MRHITVFIAMLAGLLVLAGYYLQGLFPALKSIQAHLLNAAITLAGIAVLVGIANLLSTHSGRVRRGEKGAVYSALLVISLLGTFVLGVVLRPAHMIMRAVADAVIFPVESALMGILTISLLYAAIRLLRRRADLTGIIFIVAIIIVLFGSATLPFGEIPLLGDFARWVTQVWALGGMRGVLIGVALGAFLAGLRVLFGVDRPYGGS